MNDLPDQDEEQEIPSPDPNVYQPEEDEDDELEIDRRIRRAKELISRLTIVGSPDIDIEGSWDGGGHPHGYAVNYKPLGACCKDTGCFVLSESECNSEGGEYIGNGTACIPNPCSEATTGACCDSEGNCTITTEVDCTGTFQGIGTVCDPNPCPPPTGACCIDGVCSILSANDCAIGGGIFLGVGITCDGNPCCIPCSGFTPTNIDGICYKTEICDGTFTDPIDCSVQFLRSVGIPCIPEGCTASIAHIDPEDSCAFIVDQVGNCDFEGVTLEEPFIFCESPSALSDPFFQNN